MERFGDYDSEDYQTAATLLWGAGFLTMRSVESMRTSARDMFMRDLRYDTKERRKVKDLRLLIELFEFAPPYSKKEGG